MSDARNVRFLENLTYLYGSVAVANNGSASSKDRTLITEIAAAWPLSMSPQHREVVVSKTLHRVTTDCAIYGSVLYGTPRFVESCVALSGFIGPSARDACIRDSLSIAAAHGQLSAAQGALVRALARAWQADVVIPHSGAVSVSRSLVQGERKIDVGAPVTATAFGAHTSALPLPQAWWWEHLRDLNDATVQKGAEVTPNSRTGQHVQLWNEMNKWVAQISAVALSADAMRWVNNPNQFQIGKLSYTYWARLAPEDGDDLAGGLHIGLQLSKRLKWVDECRPGLTQLASQPVLTLWASTNDRVLARLATEPHIRAQYGEVQLDLLYSHPELWARGGALVRGPGRKGQLLQPALEYLAARERGDQSAQDPGRVSLFSPLVTLDQVMADPSGVSRLVADYIRLLAEPVRNARALVLTSPFGTESASALRQEQSGASSLGPTIPQALLSLAERVQEDGVATVSARELLQWFGAQRRGAQVIARVREALAAVELEPELFEAADIDDVLTFWSDGSAARNLAPDEIDGEEDDSGYSAESCESVGEEVVASELLSVVKGKSTFTLGYNQPCWISENVVGTLGDDTLAALIAGSVDAFTWHEDDDILHAYGITVPATDLQLPDGTIVPVTLKHQPHTLDRAKLAFKASSRGDFVHVSQSTEKAYGWEGWKRYSLTLEDGVFDLARVRVEWDDGLVSGYTYEADDDEIEFDEDDRYSTTSKGVDTSFFFNDGSTLIRLDFDDLAGELEDEGIDVSDVDAVRAFLLTKGERPAPSTSIINSVAFSPDGRSILIASDDGTLRVYRVDDGACRLRIDGGREQQNCAQYSSDGSFMLSGSWQGALQAWDPDTGSLLWEQIDERPITSLVIADKHFALSGAADGSIWLRRIEADRLDHTLDFEPADNVGGSVNALAACEGGLILASASSKGIVRIWSNEDGAHWHEIDLAEDEAVSLAITADGETVAIGTASGQISLWKVETGEKLLTLDGSRGRVRSMALHPNGRILATASDGQLLHLWGVPGGDLLRTIGDKIECVTAVSFSPDGKQLATGSYDGTLQLWTTDAAREVWSIRDGATTEVEDAVNADVSLILRSLDRVEVDDDYAGDDNEDEASPVTADMIREVNRGDGGTPSTGNDEPVRAASLIEGRTFLFAGEFMRFTRGEAEDLVRGCGGKVFSGVGGKLDYLVAGRGAERQRSRARATGSVKALTEDEFLSMVDANS